MNVLITSAGRRGYLVNYFKEAVTPYGGKVVTANSEPFASGLLAGDSRYVVPLIADDNYIPALLEIVQKERIQLVFSLFDIDLPLLSEHSAEFARQSARVVVGDPGIVDICADKWKTYQFLSKNTLPTPKTFLNSEIALQALSERLIQLPLIVKPRWGMGSIGVQIVNDVAELPNAVELTKAAINRSYLQVIKSQPNKSPVIIQECIKGLEFGADILNDLEGNYVACATKQKISQRPDGAEFAFTVDHPQIASLSKSLSRLLQHRGNADVDFIQNDCGQVFIIEVNPRFGGGYPFSHLAGARYPRALVQMAKGEAPNPGRIELGVHSMIALQPQVFDPNLVSSFELSHL